jgi:copper chaperone CopZ
VFGLSGLQELLEVREGEEMSCYLHHVPGRIRIKTPSIKGRPDFAQDLEAKLGQLSGIKMVTANALTGSILVYYEENAVNAAAIVDLVSLETGSDLSAAAHPDQYVDEALSKTGKAVGVKIGKAVLGLVIGELLEGSPLALLAAAI